MTGMHDGGSDLLGADDHQEGASAATKKSATASRASGVDASTP